MLVASLPRTLVVAACALVSVALPVAFLLMTGTVVGTLPEAIEQGPDSPANQRLTVALGALGLTFLLQQILTMVQAATADALGRRVLGSHARRVMRAVTAPAGLGHLEQPAYLDQISRSLAIHWVSPHTAVSALVEESVRRLQALAALAVVATFYWWLPILLLVALLHDIARFGPLSRQIVDMRMGKAQGFRRAEYLLNLTLLPEAAKEVRVFGLADWLVGRYQTAWLSAMAELWQARSGFWRTVILAGLPVAVVELLGLILGVWDALHGALSLSGLVVLGGAIRSSTFFGQLGDTDSRIQHGAAGLRPVIELEQMLANDPSLSLPGSRSAAGRPRHEIRFEGVSFGYPDRPGRVFDGLDLAIPAGRSLAIVGENGAGKTTLVKLLARLYEPTAGRITVDGVDLRELDPHAWQRRVAAIFQDFVRYQLPASDNVTVGAVEHAADGPALLDAAARAGAQEVVDRLPNGWETILSRRFTDGADLSGGEWQRFGLARALFAASAGAGVLVLDEPTAQLDVRAEAAFYDQFFDLTRGLTTLVISHRFSTVRRADRIVVLDGGRVVESGSHDELLAADGRYAAMFRLQATRFVEDLDGGVEDPNGEGDCRNVQIDV